MGTGNPNLYVESYLPTATLSIKLKGPSAVQIALGQKYELCSRATDDGISTIGNEAAGSGCEAGAEAVDQLEGDLSQQVVLTCPTTVTGGQSQVSDKSITGVYTEHVYYSIVELLLDSLLNAQTIQCSGLLCWDSGSVYTLS